MIGAQFGIDEIQWSWKRLKATSVCAEDCASDLAECEFTTPLRNCWWTVNFTCAYQSWLVILKMVHCVEEGDLVKIYICESLARSSLVDEASLEYEDRRRRV